jgi:GNAT superfamily N-acetyltransferase
MKARELQIPKYNSKAEMRARYLDDTDQPAIFALLQACDDFSLLSSGMPSTEQDALDLLRDYPPGIPPEQKAVLGFFDPEERLVAVLDMVIGYPHESVWFIGLLLITPDHRRKGLGQKIVTSFARWAQENKASSLMIGVLECNSAALRFWKSQGFDEVERTGPRTIGLMQHMVIRMRKNLHQ